MQERGLKSEDIVYNWFAEQVAPYAGAWIEMLGAIGGTYIILGRSLCRSVD